ncbi:MAG: sporulation protein YunB [Clostridia bacterium]|nr:sporulation protein YunB [Clostridia bacterium]
MPRIYFRKKRITRRNGPLLFVILLGLMLIPINKAYDSALPLVSAAAEKCVLSAVNETVSRCAGKCEFDGLTLTERDSSGSIYGITLEAGTVNRLKDEFSTLVSEELEHSAVKIPVRIGDIIGGSVSSGRGPSIIVKVTGYSTAVTDVQSEIVTAGINQALYRMTMTVKVTGTYVLPRRETREIEYETKIPLVETLVIGSVPGYYTGY